MSLRVLLLIIGVVIIVGVYAVGVIKRRRERSAAYGRSFARLDIPDAILRHEDEEAVPDDETSQAEREPAPVLDISQPSTPHAPTPDEEDFDHQPENAAVGTAPAIALPITSEKPEELPSVRNDVLLEDEPLNARRSSDQLDLFGAESPAPATTRAAVRPAPGPLPETALEDDDGLLKLFVRATDDHPFRGPELVRALNAAGMRHGDMAIFHHFGAGDLSCERAVFSAANLFEPGTFDLDRIEAFETTGIVLFLQLPTDLDGPVAFELMLNSAQRITELMGGELYANPRNVLDPASVATLRQRAARFSAGG